MSRLTARPSLIARRGAILVAGSGAALLWACSLGTLPGCGSSASESGIQGEVLPDAAAAQTEITDEKVAPPAPSLKDLGPDWRRVKVIVLPGDASVEVDGFSARRRDGIIEMTGRVGDVRRFRIFKGTQQMERDVTFQDAGASPPILDLSTRPVTHEVWSDEAKTAKPVTKPKAPLLPDEFD